MKETKLIKYTRLLEESKVMLADCYEHSEYLDRKRDRLQDLYMDNYYMTGKDLDRMQKNRMKSVKRNRKNIDNLIKKIHKYEEKVKIFSIM